MSNTSTTIQLRVDRVTKAKAQTIFKKLGVDLSSAVKLFLAQVIKTKSIPFTVRTANGYTPEYEQMILDEAKAMKAGREKSFKTIEELMLDLNS